MKLGEFSRGGCLRWPGMVQALDHDMEPDGLLLPFGILEVRISETRRNNSTLCTENFVETRAEIMHRIVDALQCWWRYRKHHFSHIKRLQIDLDNSPELENHQTQFVKRIVEFLHEIQLPIELVYYSPLYFRNTVQQGQSGGALLGSFGCGKLIGHWSGALLTDIETVKEWSKSMCWAGIAPNVYFLNQEYGRGVTLSKQEMRHYEKWLIRKPLIDRWSLTIQPLKLAG